MDSQLAFEGRCAFAIASGAGRSAPMANPNQTLTKNGITYGFSGYMTKLLFELIPGTDKRAHKAWEQLSH